MEAGNDGSTAWNELEPELVLKIHMDDPCYVCAREHQGLLYLICIQEQRHHEIREEGRLHGHVALKISNVRVAISALDATVFRRSTTRWSKVARVPSLRLSRS